MSEKGPGMNSKKVITAALLLFVAASVVFLVAKETKQQTAGADPTTAQDGGVTETPVETGDYVVVYYFHGTARCSSCMKIDAYTKEALDAHFAAAVKSERVRWRVLNVEEPANKHFVQDYGLYTKSVVLSEIQAGKEVRSKNLAKVWELLGDKEEFITYVKDELTTYLEGP